MPATYLYSIRSNVDFFGEMMKPSSAPAAGPAPIPPSAQSPDKPNAGDKPSTGDKLSTVTDILSPPAAAQPAAEQRQLDWSSMI